jgi:DNA gyrase/topoisomerase IV subunit A
VVKKVERQYVEIAGDKAKPLGVNGRAVSATIQKFQWDLAQFQNQGRSLQELVVTIQNIAGKSEEELKIISTSFTEKNAALALAKRRQIINYTTSDFEDFLTPEEAAKVGSTNTQYLLTVAVVVPKAQEQGKISSFFNYFFLMQIFFSLL